MRQNSRSVRLGTAAGCRSPGGLMRPMCGSRGAGSTSTARSTKMADARLLPRRPAQRQGRQALPFCRLEAQPDWIPRVINTDKNPAYDEAIAELKKEGLLPKDTQHRQLKYLNNWL